MSTAPVMRMKLRDTAKRVAPLEFIIQGRFAPTSLGRVAIKLIKHAKMMYPQATAQLGMAYFLVHVALARVVGLARGHVVRLMAPFAQWLTARKVVWAVTSGREETALARSLLVIIVAR